MDHQADVLWYFLPSFLCCLGFPASLISSYFFHGCLGSSSYCTIVFFYFCCYFLVSLANLSIDMQTAYYTLHRCCYLLSAYRYRFCCLPKKQKTRMLWCTDSSAPWLRVPHLGREAIKLARPMPMLFGPRSKAWNKALRHLGQNWEKTYLVTFFAFGLTISCLRKCFSSGFLHLLACKCKCLQILEDNLPAHLQVQELLKDQWHKAGWASWIAGRGQVFGWSVASDLPVLVWDKPHKKVRSHKVLTGF